MKSVRRTDGAPDELRVALAETTLGALLVASSAVGIAAILLGDEPGGLASDLEVRFPAARLIVVDERASAVVAAVVRLVETPRSPFALPLDIRGSAFQREVWQVLREIPAGTTVSYTEVARRVGTPGAVRAVAGACAANRLAVVVPCHRVVRSDGALSGYAWGVERKRALLDRERASA